MSIFWSAAANVLVRSFPVHLAAYYPFRDRLRLPLWKVLLAVFAMQMVQMVFYGYAVWSGGAGKWVSYGFAPLYLWLYFSTVREDRFKALFLYLLCADYVIILRGISAFMEVQFFFEPEMKFDSWISLLLSLAVTAASIPLMYRFFARTRDKIFRVDAPAFWRTTCQVPVFLTMIVLIFTDSFTPRRVNSFGFLFARVLLLLYVLTVYYIMPDVLDSIHHQAALKERNAVQEQLLQLQREQHGQLMQHMEEVRAARHDLRQNMNIIRAYLDKDDIEGLKAYLGVYEKNLPAGTHRTYTKNFALNAVCVYYAEEARKHEIDYNITMDMPEQLPINEPEVCAMLGNLLENAVEACQEVERSVPFIRGRGLCEKNCIVLTVDNTCEQEPIWENGRLVSSKHGGFGTGTWIVRGMAERCGGRAEFSYKNGVFSSSVLLYG